MSTAARRSAARFNRDVTLFAAKTRLQVGIIAKKLAFEAFTGIVKKTPVDTGRARASWNISVGRVDPSVAPKSSFPRGSTPGDSGGDDPTGKLGDVQDPIDPFTKWYVTNNLIYIRFLEDGSSTQAPTGMVKVTIEELRRDFSRTVRV